MKARAWGKEALADLREWLDRTPGDWHWGFSLAGWTCLLAGLIKWLLRC